MVDPNFPSLFTYTDHLVKIPEDWGLTIIVAIYKREPETCLLITVLLPFKYNKLYARHLHNELVDWVHLEYILADEQADFRTRLSIYGVAFIFQDLAI